ncbi:MAG: hypothetical protein QM790_07555 [Nibricoccus sp.]
MSVLGPIADLAAPDLAMGNRLPHRREELVWVNTRLEYAMGVANQFFPAIPTHLTKTIVRIGDYSLKIGDRHDRVLIQRELLARNLIKRAAQFYLSRLGWIPGWGHRPE